MLEATTGWSIDLDRGPNCLLIHLRPEGGQCPDSAGLSAALNELLQIEFANRIVVDLRYVPCVSEQLLDELVQLLESVTKIGGLMRVCGLSAANLNARGGAQSSGPLPVYDTPEDALCRLCPGKPR